MPSFKYFTIPRYGDIVREILIPEVDTTADLMVSNEIIDTCKITYKTGEITPLKFCMELPAVFTIFTPFGINFVGEKPPFILIRWRFLDNPTRAEICENLQGKTIQINTNPKKEILFIDGTARIAERENIPDAPSASKI